MTLQTRLRWVRAGGLYDMLAAWPLLTPWSFELMIQGLDAANHLLGLPGATSRLDPLHQMLGSMLACLVMLWGWARWRQPSLQLGRIDAVARLVFSLNYVAAVLQGLPGLIWVYAAIELAFLLGQLPCFFREPESPTAALRCPASSHS